MNRQNGSKKSGKGWNFHLEIYRIFKLSRLWKMDPFVNGLKNRTFRLLLYGYPLESLRCVKRQSANDGNYIH